MNQQQEDRIVKAQTTFFATSRAKSAAESLSASTGAALDTAKRYAASGVKNDIANLQSRADADEVVKQAAYDVAFQAACDATNTNGAAELELANATRDGLQNPGAIEATNPNATPPITS